MKKQLSRTDRNKVTVMHEGQRVIRWFDPRTDREVGSEPIRPVPLTELQRLFGIPADNPMYDCSPIEAKHLETVQPLVNHPIDLNRFDYFLEFDAAHIHSPSRLSSVSANSAS